MQTHKQSIIETAVNTFSGALIAYLITLYVLPFWGFEPTHSQALEMTIVYYMASLARGYIIRRIFNGR